MWPRFLTRYRCDVLNGIRGIRLAQDTYAKSIEIQMTALHEELTEIREALRELEKLLREVAERR